VLTAVLLLISASAFAQTGAPPVRTLGDAYRRALEASETIAISQQSIRQAEDLYRAALGSSFPLVSLRSATAWQDGDRGRSATDLGARLSQTGLSGYRELFEVRSAKAFTGQREYERLRADQLLLADVGAAFYGLLQSRENVRVTGELEGFARSRLVELKDRVRVGRAREADAIAQDVQLAALESQLEENQRQADARVDLLLYLTLAGGIEPATSETPAEPQLPDLAGYLAKVESRPDVEAARKAADAAADRVHVARADLFPQASLQADWYGSRPSDSNRIRWDGQLILSLPVWSWGSLSASLDAAKSASTIEELLLSSTRRQARLEVENAYRDYSSARKQLDIQRRAVDLAERDYSLQIRDEKRGLITSIEVLQSLDRLNGARLAYTNALLQARLAILNLELSAGAKPEEMDLR
jgi:outer membrane protein